MSGATAIWMPHTAAVNPWTRDRVRTIISAKVITHCGPAPRRFFAGHLILKISLNDEQTLKEKLLQFPHDHGNGHVEFAPDNRPVVDPMDVVQCTYSGALTMDCPHSELAMNPSIELKWIE
jgi:hypothetical protein